MQNENGQNTLHRHLSNDRLVSTLLVLACGSDLLGPDTVLGERMKAPGTGPN